MPAATKKAAAKPAKLKRVAAKKAASATNGTAPQQQFSSFMDEVLKNPEARAAFEDASARTTLIETLAAMRAERGLSQGELARLAGVNQASISHMESGSQMSVSVVQRVARALGGRLEIRFVR